MADSKKVAHRLMGVKETCEYCRFWEVDDRDGYYGECRRHSPAPGKDGDSLFPATTAETWCGDFVLRPRKGKSGQ